MSPVDTVKNGGWFSNLLIGALVGALITSAIAAVSFGRNLPTRSEVVEMIQEQSPYMRDRSGIEQRLKNIETILSEIKEDLKEERKLKR